jgi:IS5 family transposase
MRPRERRDSGQSDLFKARLDRIVDMNHSLAKLARAIDWGFLEKSFGAVYSDGPGQPPLATRLMAGLAILKHMQDLSPMRSCAIVGWRTHIFSCFAARSFSATGSPSTVRR